MKDELTDDPLRCVRGILSAVFLSLPLWGLLYFAVRLLKFYRH